MKRVYIFAIALVVFVSLPVSATIINIPGDYPTIQQGIDASTDGDTVLVQPGTYVENINFNGHNILLGSLFLTTGDTSYVSSTIIDGNSSGSVVTFENAEDTAVIICGFKLRNGLSVYGGGVKCISSQPSIMGNIITENSSQGLAAGIYCYGSNPIISDNRIDGNSGGATGGIFCRQSNPIIVNNEIINNSAHGSGGGIYCFQGDPIIINNTIARNTDDIGGVGGIKCYGSDAIITNTIVWGNFPGSIASTSGSPVISYSAIQGGWDGEGNIDINPLLVEPENGNFNICSQSPCLDAGDPDMTDPDGTRADMGRFHPDHPQCNVGNVWHVSTSGDDIYGDGSPENPFRTIQHAIDVSFHYDSVIVENGIFQESIDPSGKSILIASNFIFSGNFVDIQNTIIDGESSSRVVTFESGEDSSTVIDGFTLQNGQSVYGGGIYCSYANPQIRNNIINENSASINGGGFYSSNSYPIVVNNIIAKNSANAYGGGIYCSYSAPIFGNNTICDNSAGVAGGAIYSESCNPIVLNSIIWGNIPEEVSNSAVITYSDIRDGWDGEGNIDENPLLLDLHSGDYNVCFQSPCIDAGDPNTFDPDGSRADIGFYFPEHPVCEFGSIWFVSTTGDDSTGDGTRPNPFRTIQFAIDNAFHLDTIIVENGIYFESISYYGKAILLASEYIFSEDSADVANTIIDGESVSAVVDFRHAEDEDSELRGFTIQNGYSAKGGVVCISSGPTIMKNIIRDNISSEAGGGIFAKRSSLKIIDNIITENQSAWSGGGIYCGDNSFPQIDDNIVALNSAVGQGGGLYIEGSFPSISENTFVGNSSAAQGGGICGAGLGGGTLRENEIIENSAGHHGGVISIGGIISVFRDNIIRNNEAGWGGGGMFCEGFNSTIANNQIIENYANGGGGIYINGSDLAVIVGNTIIGNSAVTAGGGITSSSSNLAVRQNIVGSNLANDQGGGIYIDSGSPLVLNNSIIGNSGGWGGGIYFEDSYPLLRITNNTLCRNTASVNADGIYCGTNSISIVANTILWDDTTGNGQEIFIAGGNTNFIYNDIQGGWEGEGNIDIDPLFRDPENGDFHLMSTACGDPQDSPCIDAGSPPIIDSLLDCSWGLGTILSDMGAYGGGDSATVGITDQQPRVPDRFALLQNYPNPFNTRTVIRYIIPTDSDVTIEIFDILGRKVETLVQGDQQAGFHQVVWDAEEDPSGMYFYRIKAGVYAEIRKMVLLK